MTALKRIEAYSELRSLPCEESIVDHISDVPHPYKEKILEYLSSGELSGVCCHLVEDKIKKKYTNIADCFYTDGEFEWKDEEIYHFKEYNMELDPEFIKKVIA